MRRSNHIDRRTMRGMIYRDRKINKKKSIAEEPYE
jgi:hypothetical protein